MPAIDLQAGLVLDGVYTLRQVLGRGAAGQVWLAEDVNLRRKVALKVVPPELVEMHADAWKMALRREATAMATVKHPGVAQVFAFGRHLDLHYFIMEWIEGEPLAEEIDRRRERREPIPVRRALRIVADACLGLGAVHAAGLVHRDVKPSNLMMARDGRVVLIDFGLVRMPDGAGLAGVPVGTPRYMAPELVLTPGQAPTRHDHLADIYSLGATAYDLCTGSPPFPGEGAQEVMQRHIHEMPTIPSQLREDLDESIDRLLLRALSKQPKDRYPSCADMRAAFLAGGT